MPDTDIDSLDYGSAREYVLAFLTTLKQTQREQAIAQEELSLWAHRVKLAGNRGEPQLKKTADGRVAELRERTSRLTGEEGELKRKVAALKQKLQVLRQQASFTVDADALLAQLRMVTGEPETLSRAVREQEAQAALEQLKSKRG
jgi:VIT1/CCC1 family predicted Fe2+/Mn2+ transporter